MRHSRAAVSIAMAILLDVRIHVVAVDADGRPIAETMGPVIGDIPPGGRGYFAVALAGSGAAGYRVKVVSFDEVSSGR